MSGPNPIRNTAVVYYEHTSDSVKDYALKFCIASGEGELFLDVETVDMRMVAARITEDTEETYELYELRKIIKQAKEVNAEYIHLF